MASGVLALTGGGLAIALGFFVLLIAGVMGAFNANNGGSAAVAGLLAVLFGFCAIGSTALLLLPRLLPGLAALGFSIAGLLWAFSRVDAIGLALIPVLPLAFAALCALAAFNGHGVSQRDGQHPLSVEDGEGAGG